MPPLRTSHSTSFPRIARTSSSIRPSDKSTRAPGSTSRASPGKSVEMSVALPGTERGVMVSRLPFLSSTGAPSFNRPVRIFGPCRSCKMQIVRFSLRAASRNRWMRPECSACVPCEKLRRATSMPSRISSPMHSAESQAGPIVQTIFARRPQAAGSGTFDFMSAILVANAPLGFREAARKEHRIEFCANQHDQRDEVHPREQRDAHAQ